MLNEKMVVFGGYFTVDDYSNEVWTMDLKTHAWSLLQPTETAPSGRTHVSSVVWNGNMVVFGGHEDSRENYGLLNDAWTMDPNPTDEPPTTPTPSSSESTSASTTDTPFPRWVSVAAGLLFSYLL